MVVCEPCHWSGLKESSRLTSLPANAVDPSQGELDLELDLGRKPSPLGGETQIVLDDQITLVTMVPLITLTEAPDAGASVAMI